MESVHTGFQISRKKHQGKVLAIPLYSAEVNFGEIEARVEEQLRNTLSSGNTGRIHHYMWETCKEKGEDCNP